MASAMRDRKSVDDRMVRETPGMPHANDGKQWEFKTVTGSRSMDLNLYGADGWELVSVIAQPGDQAAYYFTRRK